MTYLVILAALMVVPIALIAALRVNAAIAFMSLCLGSVLARYTSNDVASIASGLSSSVSPSLIQWVGVVLLLLPFVLTVLFTRGSVSSKKLLINLLPAIATGLLLALLLIPLLPPDLQSHLYAQKTWRILDNAQTSVILGGASFSLLALLFTHRGSGGEDHKKHGKH